MQQRMSPGMQLPPAVAQERQQQMQRMAALQQVRFDIASKVYAELVAVSFP